MEVLEPIGVLILPSSEYDLHIRQYFGTGMKRFIYQESILSQHKNMDRFCRLHIKICL